ncbi:penicillin-binding protein [Alteribacter lacisalsi]|uniref:Penicillin-binding protein n=1 Tax=Alteribacter lacisalsi TaxID=2045244 RepID=A0A2W0HBZ4_9BACI|nr:penicillin-binding protein 1A [Alteribacter lacisalsi]PYZ98381.1 penicillin-binding protein [Alteribacter lacisalsi]
MSDEYRTRQERKKAMSHTKNRNSSKSSGKPGKSRVKKILTALAIVFAVIFAAGGITAVAMIAGAPDLDEDKLRMSNNPEFYDKDGEMFATLSGAESRRHANIEDVPPVMKDAIISIEDIRFYDHFGLDMRRLGGAVWANVTGGFGAEGASTITQQVVKNLFLSSDKKISRKVQEQYLAVRLEQRYTKDEILEMYLNMIYLSGPYGVVEASDRFFSKELDELTVADAALLAGLPQRPTAYHPLNHPERAEQRRNTVINQMERYGKITAEEAEEARNTPIEDQLNPSTNHEEYPYQSYMDHVLNELESIEGIESSDIYSSGMKVYTNLDTGAQEYVEDLMQNGLNYPDEETLSAVTLMDSETGRVTAIGGQRAPSEERRIYNLATQINRAPGSTIKPILDYGPAIENFQWSTYHQITDEEHTYTDSEQVIRNSAGRGYFGDVSMREALALSLNVPALKAFQEVGSDQARSFGESLGMPLDNMTEAYSLGGFRDGVSTLEMAGAYGAFANGGHYTKPYTVERVEFPDGRTIDLTPDTNRVMEDYTAFMISDMLKTAASSEGTGQHANVDGIPLAGKTGSTNFTSEEREDYGIPSDANAIKDGWFVGYSSRYTAAVWTGYNDNSNGFLSGTRLAQDKFRQVMAHVHEGQETPDFEQPDSVVRVGVEKETGLLPSDFTPDSAIVHEYFVKGTEPSSVSEEYEVDADDLGSPQLEAAYNENLHSIIANWSFSADVPGDFTFRVELREPGENDYSEVDMTKETDLVIENPEYGGTYSFRITAVSDEDENLESEPASTEVTVPEEEDLIEDDDGILDDIFEDEDAEEGTEEEDEEQEDNGNGNDDGEDNGNDNGNGNGNDNGNDNGNGNGNDNGNGDGNGNDDGSDDDNGPPEDDDSEGDEDEEEPPEPEEDDSDDGETGDTEQDPEE